MPDNSFVNSPKLSENKNENDVAEVLSFNQNNKI